LEDEWLTDEGRSAMTVWRKLPTLGTKLSRRELANAIQQRDSGKLGQPGGDDADADSLNPADSLHAMLSSTRGERETRTIKEGTVLFTQGDEATEAYYIQEGTAEIFVERCIDLPGLGKVAGRRRTRDVGPGDLLGEVDLFLDGNVRTASVAALSDMKVTVIQRSEISDWFEKEPEAASAAKDKANDFRQLRRQVSGQLRKELQIKLGMGIESFPSINEDLPERRYRAGSIIFSAGEDAGMVWWVRKGSVRELHVAKGQSLDEAITIKECEQGDFIGYATFMLDRKKRLVTAVASTPVELVGLSKSLFLQLVCSNPELEVKLRAHAQEIIAETESFIATRLREVARMVIAAQRMKRISERNEDGSRSASSVAGTDTGTDDDDQVNRLRY
jgi:CRP-like cAMP-binding protein